jgi:hypothetical protein
MKPLTAGDTCIILNEGGERVFIYGQDIPLEEAVIEQTADPFAGRQAVPVDYLFEYGKPIFPDDPADS